MKILFWCLVALNLLDYWFTDQILRMGGYEANPWMDWVIQHSGTVGILYVKLPLLAILGITIYFYWHTLSSGFRVFAETLIPIAVGLYTVLFFWSLSLYLRMVA